MIDIYLIPVMVTLIIISSAVTIAYLIKLFTSLNHKDNPTDENYIKEAQKKANQIILQAIKGAHKIMVRSELAGIKQIAKEKLEVEKIDRRYKKELETLAAKLFAGLDLHLEKQKKEYESYLLKTGKQLEESFSESKKRLLEKMDQFLEAESGTFSSFSQEVKNQIKSQVEEEMIKVNAEVENYKKARVIAIDKNIAAIVTAATLKVLGKKLTLDEQTDLVLKALDQAKVEKFLS